MFGNFSSMMVTDREGNATSTGLYSVLYSPMSGASVYKASVTVNNSVTTTTGQVWVRPNGTVLAVYEDGQNSTGASAFSAASTLTFVFAFEAYRPHLLPLYLTSSSVYVLNQTSILIGGTTVDVTNYGASSYPITVTNCVFSLTFTNFFFQLGKVPGTTFQIATIVSTTGHETAPGGTYGFDETIRITSITKA